MNFVYGAMILKRTRKDFSCSSQLADRYVTDPTQVVRLHQHVRVRVIGVDLRRQRISLSMKGMNKK